jgi:phosphinothricin acetyltransferase
MIAAIGGSGNLASIRLHESLGFRVAGQLKSVGFKHNQWLDTVYLQLSLGPGDTTVPTRI